MSLSDLPSDIQYMNHVQEFLTSEKYIIELQRFMEEDLMK